MWLWVVYRCGSCVAVVGFVAHVLGVAVGRVWLYGWMCSECVVCFCGSCVTVAGMWLDVCQMCC